MWHGMVVANCTISPALKLEVMNTRSDLMRRTPITLATFGMALLALASVSVSRADWVAFNDHVPGTGTSTNATTNNIRSQTIGPLKNIVNGTNLPVTLAITH